jgi:hypothetical protein
MRSLPSINVEKARLKNYVHHFECFTFACTLTDDERNLYIQLARMVKPAGLNLAGVTDRSPDDWQAVEDLAIKYKVDCWLINPFYLTAAGWEGFQEHWKNLPELVHRGVCTTDGLVLLVHSRDETLTVLPDRKRATVDK